MRILVFANAFHIISGGDKIFAEYSKRWIKSGEKISIVTNEKGKIFCLNHGISRTNVWIWKTSFTDKFGVFISSVYKSLSSLIRCFFLNIRSIDAIFSSSNLWPDVFPAFIIKIRKPKVLWFSACYLIVPSPFSRDGKIKGLKGLISYIVQQISLKLIRIRADAVLTASPIDCKSFYNGRLTPKRVIAIRGGVDFELFQRVPKQKAKFDAVFVGRLHPQKCLEELLDIWREVLKKDSPKRKLAIVGTGPLENKLRKKVMKENMKNNVMFLGLLDGIEKAKVLKASRLFVSASRLDSGNMALDEALACGLPGVIYNLPRLYYPKGVIKIPCFQKKTFVKTILKLLNSEDRRIQLGKEGKKFAKGLNWDIGAAKSLKSIKEINSFNF